MATVLARIARSCILCAALVVFLTPLGAQRAYANVTISSFTAQAQGSQVKLSWATASEINNVGFNLLRSSASNGTYSKLNANLIPSQCLGCVAGANYSYTDSATAIGQTYFYKLESRDISGSTQLFGPASAALTAPTATPTVPPSSTPTVLSTRTSTATPTKTIPPANTVPPNSAPLSVPTALMSTPVATAARTATLAPTTAIPSRTVTGVPQATPSINAAATQVAIVVASPTPPVRQAAGTRVLPSATPSPQVQAAVIPTMAPIVEMQPQEVVETRNQPEEEPEEAVAEPSSSRMDLDRFLLVGSIGLAALCGAGSLASGILAIVLLARATRRQ